jgi:hypothetical protein
MRTMSEKSKFLTKLKVSCLDPCNSIQISLWTSIFVPLLLKKGSFQSQRVKVKASKELKMYDGEIAASSTKTAGKTG